MKLLLLSLLLAIFMTGCFKNEPPKCSEEEVQTTLQNIYVEVLENVNNSGNPFLAGFSQNLPKKIQALSSIRPVAYDESVKIRSCKAEALFDNNQTASIKYTVQTNEESSDEFYVELDTEFLEGLMQQSIMKGLFNN